MIDISERLLISWKRTHISERNFITQTWKTSRYCTALFPNSTLQTGLIGLSKHPVDNLLFSVWWKQQGKLAKELDFVSHHVRTKLDELKRQEVNRLRTLIKVKQDINGEKGITASTLLLLLFCGSHLPLCIFVSFMVARLTEHIFARIQSVVSESVIYQTPHITVYFINL